MAEMIPLRRQNVAVAVVAAVDVVVQREIEVKAVDVAGVVVGAVVAKDAGMVVVEEEAGTVVAEAAVVLAEVDRFSSVAK